MTDQTTTLRDPLRTSLIDKTAKALLFKVLSKLELGCLTITVNNENFIFGNPDSSLKASIQIFDPRAFRALTFKGSIGAGESYFDGLWDCDNLTNVIRIFAANIDTLDSMDNKLAFIQKPFLAMLKLRKRNSIKGAKKNIMAHYDISNDMYQTFLDDTMMYSSAFYESADTTLEQASLKKLEKICEKLKLSPNDHVVEIGSGWGGFAIYAAKNYGCKVTTTTISEEQYREAKQRVTEAGLDDKIELLKKDYRLLEGQYDKLVSIEMIEAIGLDNYEVYFKKCQDLLKPNGKMLIQAITIADRRFESAAQNTDFIQKYIFPGGSLPSVEYLSRKVRESTILNIRHLEDFGLHYARTLRDWRERFMHNKNKLFKLNFDETFLRLWEFYLCYCEGAFLERNISVIHLVLDKHQNRHLEA